MNYRKFFITWIVSFILCSIILVGGSIVVDPVGIFGFTTIKGLNNYKTKEGNYLDVGKPYQVLRAEPKAVIIGSSRVYIGVRPTLEKYTDDDVYNLGCSALSLRHAELLLDMLYARQKPEVILFGVDFFQFGKENFNDIRTGFSEERLATLASASKQRMFLEGLKDSIGVCSAIVPTIKDSLSNKNNQNVFVRGWYRTSGERRKTDVEVFYGDLNSYIRQYNEWEYDENSIKCLRRIVRKADANGVKLYVFINPLNSDLRSIIYSLDLADDMNRIKREVADISGALYDFSFSNDITNNRDNYIDGSHYNDSIGELIKDSILKSTNNEICYVINSDNSEKILDKENQAYYQWEAENKDYVELLARKAQAKEKIKIGELNEFL